MWCVVETWRPTSRACYVVPEQVLWTLRVLIRIEASEWHSLLSAIHSSKLCSLTIFPAFRKSRCMVVIGKCGLQITITITILIWLFAPAIKCMHQRIYRVYVCVKHLPGLEITGLLFPKNNSTIRIFVYLRNMRVHRERSVGRSQV